MIIEQGIDWVEVPHGTRVTIELEAKYQRGRGSVDEYLEGTAIANPHATLHYTDPEGNTIAYMAGVSELPPEPVEIKPHPYGIELGYLINMLCDTRQPTLLKFLTESFCASRRRWLASCARRRKLSPRPVPTRCGVPKPKPFFTRSRNQRFPPLQPTVLFRSGNIIF